MKFCAQNRCFVDAQSILLACLSENVARTTLKVLNPFPVFMNSTCANSTFLTMRNKLPL